MKAIEMILKQNFEEEEIKLMQDCAEAFKDKNEMKVFAQEQQFYNLADAYNDLQEIKQQIDFRKKIFNLTNGVDEGHFLLKRFVSICIKAESEGINLHDEVDT